MSNGIKINELDKSILYKLDINGREAISKIATEMGRSKKVIQYRIKRMQKSGLYMKDVLLLDTSKLGYHTYSLYLQLSNMLRIEDIIEYLKKTHQIWGIDKIIGKYQLYTSVYVKSVAELEGVIIDLGTEFGDIISDYRLLLLYNGTSNAHNYLFPEKKLIEHTKVRLASEKIELSRKEKLIIHFLTDNPRMSFNAISEKIDSTLRQVRKMYNGLVEKGVIMYIRPSLNSRKLDYLHKHIIIKMKFSAMKYLIGIKEHLVSLRTTKAVYLTLGRYDITGRFIFSNLEEFNKFKEDFYSHFGGYIDSFISDDYYEDVDYAPHRAIEMFAKEE